MKYLFYKQIRKQLNLFWHFGDRYVYSSEHEKCK